MNETVAPAVDSARSRRADLHGIMVQLEEALAAAAPGREESWAQRVHGVVDRLAEAFAHHVEATEGTDGLFEQVRRRAPRLDMQCRHLTNEHRRIDEELATAKAALDGGVDEARKRLLDLLAHLARHRQGGADLVYEAYAVDLGGSD